MLDLRLQPVVREITDSRARTRDDIDSLYRKIVSYLLLRSGLGNATDVGAVREATGSFHTSSDWVFLLYTALMTAQIYVFWGHMYRFF